MIAYYHGKIPIGLYSLSVVFFINTFEVFFSHIVLGKIGTCGIALGELFLDKDEYFRTYKVDHIR